MDSTLALLNWHSIRLGRSALKRFAAAWLGVLTVIAMTGCLRMAKDRQPKCFVFPAGFVGWASVRYNDSSANALPQRDGCVWLDFRDGPNIRTSSAIEQGWASDKYFEQSKPERTLLLLGPSNGRAIQEHIFQFTGTGRTPDASVEEIFVGTQEERKSVPQPNEPVSGRP